MSDLYARFYPRRHIDSSATCAFCVVANHTGQRPMVTVYFPVQTYNRLMDGMLSLQPSHKGGWMVGSTQTTVRNLKDWLSRYEAWDLVRDAETILLGDTWKDAGEWRYYLARAS